MATGETLYLFLFFHHTASIAEINRRRYGVSEHKM